jgi:RHS repeat-associated protein
LTQSQIGNTHVFQGLTYDSDLKFYYVRNRWYSPDLQRFVNRDPIRYDAGDVNLYRFVGNNPVNELDPIGLKMFKMPDCPVQPSTTKITIKSSSKMELFLF